MGFLGDLLVGVFSSGGFGSSGSFGSSGGIIREPFYQNDSLSDAIIDHIKENDDGPIGGILRITEEAKEEFSELLTVGFYEMVIKGNSNYKTSSEICSEANRIVYEQTELFKSKCGELNELISNLNKRIVFLYDEKIKLAQVLNIETAKMETVESTIENNLGLEPSYSSKMTNINMLMDCIGLNEIASMSNRISSAKEYLNDAKDYEICISQKIAEMNKITVSIKTVNKYLDEEESILSALSESVKMKRELEYEKIAVQLHKMLSEYFLTENCEMNEKYKVAINRIKDLCENL